MLAHEKIRKSLASKSKGRGNSSASKSSKKPASSPSTSVPLDLDDRFEAQHDRLVRDMNERMELLSSSLLDQIKNLIGVQDSNSANPNLNLHGASAFPRRDSYHSVPEPPPQQSGAASEGGKGTRKAGVASAPIDDSLPKARAVQAPQFHEEHGDLPPGGSSASDRRDWSYEDDRMDDDDLEDREQAAEPPLDRAFARLVDYIYGQFPHSKPQSAAPSAPRCEYESYFAVNDPPEPAQKFMRLYPRVSAIQTSVHDYAANLSRESRPLFRVLPSRRRAFSIGDAPDFCRQRFLNSDFARI